MEEDHTQCETEDVKGCHDSEFEHFAAIDEKGNDDNT